MKRAFLRKVKPVSCSSCVDHTSVGESEQTPSGVKRRTRTSAAMVGLALSMGATSLLAPRQGDSATAAESKRSEATPSSVSHVATRPAGVDAGLASASPATETVDYVVRQGQTLRQIAEHYQISVERLAAANKLNLNATLKAGQVLKVPAEQFAADKLNQAQSPQLLALADLSRLPTLNPVDENAEVEVRAERNQALNRLEQQRSKLRDRLAELRRGESENLVADTSVASAGTTQSAPAANEIAPSVASLPSPTASSTDLDWMRVNQALVLPDKSPATIGQTT
ncbi:MAG TPA: LysM peptidoglycan-binding domain-containing protein, partial [Allocoleopsis sp.]